VVESREFGQRHPKNREAKMRSLFPSTYDGRCVMSAGCSTFVSAALILVIPRVGIVLLKSS